MGVFDDGDTHGRRRRRSSVTTTAQSSRPDEPPPAPVPDGLPRCAASFLKNLDHAVACFGCGTRLERSPAAQRGFHCRGCGDVYCAECLTTPVFLCESVSSLVASEGAADVEAAATEAENNHGAGLRACATCVEAHRSLRHLCAATQRLGKATEASSRLNDPSVATVNAFAASVATQKKELHVRLEDALAKVRAAGLVPHRALLRALTTSVDASIDDAENAITQHRSRSRFNFTFPVDDAPFGGDPTTGTAGADHDADDEDGAETHEVGGPSSLPRVVRRSTIRLSVASTAAPLPEAAVPQGGAGFNDAASDPEEGPSGRAYSGPSSQQGTPRLPIAKLRKLAALHSAQTSARKAADQQQAAAPAYDVTSDNVDATLDGLVTVELAQSVSAELTATIGDVVNAANVARFCSTAAQQLVTYAVACANRLPAGSDDTRFIAAVQDLLKFLVTFQYDDFDSTAKEGGERDVVRRKLATWLVTSPRCCAVAKEAGSTTQPSPFRLLRPDVFIAQFDALARAAMPSTVTATAPKPPAIAAVVAALRRDAHDFVAELAIERGNVNGADALCRLLSSEAALLPSFCFEAKEQPSLEGVLTAAAEAFRALYPMSTGAPAKLQCSANAYRTDPRDAAETLLRFAASPGGHRDPRRMEVIGPAGSGRSTQLIQLAHRLLSREPTDKNDGVAGAANVRTVPVYVPLRRVPTSSESIVAHLERTLFGTRGLALLTAACRAGSIRVVLCIDDYDAEASTLDLATRSFAALEAAFGCPRYVLATTRASPSLTSDEAPCRIVKCYLLALVDDDAVFATVSALVNNARRDPFSEVDWPAMQRTVSVDSVMERLAQHGARGLAANPFLLRLAICALPMLEPVVGSGGGSKVKSKKTKSGGSAAGGESSPPPAVLLIEVFDAFALRWRNRTRLRAAAQGASVRRGRALADAGLHFARRLALAMWTGRLSSVNAAEEPWRSDFFATEGDWFDASNAPIVLADTSAVRFAHPYLQDFFAVSAMLRTSVTNRTTSSAGDRSASGSRMDMAAAAEEEGRQLSTELRTALASRRLTLDDRCAILLCADRVRVDDAFAAFLVGIVKESASASPAGHVTSELVPLQSPPPQCVASANAMSILIAADRRVDRWFPSGDLANIALRGALLSGSIWHGFRLDGADFSEAALDNAEFLDCSFDGTGFVGVRWGWRESPLELNVFAVSNASDVVIGTADGRVQVWSLDAGCQGPTLKLAFEGHAARVTSVVASPDGSIIATTSLDETARLWDAKTGRRLHVLGRHVGAVNGIAFSPDGRLAITACSDQMLRLWNTSNGKLLRALDGHTGSVESVAFCPDGHSFASGSWDKTVRLWTGGCVDVLNGHTGRVRCVVYSPNGGVIASAGDDAVRLWGATTAKALCACDASGNKNGETNVVFSPCGDTIARAVATTVRLWDTATGTLQRVLEGHTSAVHAVAFSPDGSLYSAGADRRLRVWDVASPAAAASQLHLVSAGPPPTELATGATVPRLAAVAMSPDNALIATVGSGGCPSEVEVWDSATGVRVQTLDGCHDAPVSSIAFNRVGVLITGSWDGLAATWSVASGEVQRTFDGHTDKITAVDFRRDGITAATASNDKSVRLWDAAAGEQLYVLNGHRLPVTSVTFSPNGDFVASGSWDRTVRVWDVVLGDLVAVLDTEQHDKVRCVAFNFDGSVIAAGAGKALCFWATPPPLPSPSATASSPTGRSASPTASAAANRVRREEYHEDKISAVAFVRSCWDGCGGQLREVVVTGSWDRSVCLMELSAHPRRSGGGSTPPPSSAATTGGRGGTGTGSSNGRTAAAGSEARGDVLAASSSRSLSIQMAQSAVADDTALAPVFNMRAHTAEVYGVAVSPDGTTIASISVNGTVRLWKAPEAVSALLADDDENDEEAPQPRSTDFLRLTLTATTMGTLRGLGCDVAGAVGLEPCIAELLAQE